jgi:hypothetical protein
MTGEFGRKLVKVGKKSLLTNSLTATAKLCGLIKIATMSNDFAQYVRTAVKPVKVAGPKAHGERAHSKYSASGAERWFSCPGSVNLSEGIPSKSSVWAKEGTEAHEVLEQLMIAEIRRLPTVTSYPTEMLRHGIAARDFIIGLHRQTPHSEIMVETRIYLDFIDPEMFGTFDGAVVDHFGTLHVFDYKYGAGVAVSPKENLQMIFYGIGLAHRFDWNFKRVRLWIVQPRIKGYEGPLYWDISIGELQAWVYQFQKAVDRVKRFPKKYVEGSHCHWCPAKSICPLKTEGKLEKAKAVFSIPIQKEIEDFY